MEIVKVSFYTFSRVLSRFHVIVITTDMKKVTFRFSAYYFLLFCVVYGNRNVFRLFLNCLIRNTFIEKNNKPRNQHKVSFSHFLKSE